MKTAWRFLAAQKNLFHNLAEGNIMGVATENKRLRKTNWATPGALGRGFHPQPLAYKRKPTSRRALLRKAPLNQA